MATPYIGQISMFGGNFAPVNYAFCNGQLISISQNTALFSLIGTTYGGNGQTTFALPDLRGRVPVHQGAGPGLSTYVMGQSAGQESVTLLTTQMPVHSHASTQASGASDAPATATDPAGRVFAVPTDGSNAYGSVANSAMGGGSLGIQGSSAPHSNMQPFLCISFIIALEGIFPSRN